MTSGLAIDLALGFVCGLALGALHLVWLRRASARLGDREAGIGPLLGGAALRLIVMLAGFALVAWAAGQPAPALIAALGGFTIARSLGLWRARRGNR